MQDDNHDTSPDTKLLQLVYDELIELRTYLRALEKRLNIIERVVNGLKMSVELVQNQYQENGSEIANIRQVCRKHSEMLSRLISKTSQPPPVKEENGGSNERRRPKT